MKSINFGGKLYINPSYGALLELGMSDSEASSLMGAIAGEEVLAERVVLLQAAALSIAPLQDAVDLGAATEAEKTRLLAWKQYRVDLSRIEQQAGFPTAIDWPESPAQ